MLTFRKLATGHNLRSLPARSPRGFRAIIRCFRAGLFDVGGLQPSGFSGPPASNVTGGGNLTLTGGAAGTLDVLIIPRRAAAPIGPQEYSVGGMLTCARQQPVRFAEDCVMREWCPGSHDLVLHNPSPS